MSKPKRAVGVFDHRKRYLFSCESIGEASERTGILYTTVQRASHSKSHRAKNYYIVPMGEIR